MFKEIIDYFSKRKRIANLKKAKESIRKGRDTYICVALSSLETYYITCTEVQKKYKMDLYTAITQFNANTNLDEFGSMGLWWSEDINEGRTLSYNRQCRLDYIDYLISIQ